MSKGEVTALKDSRDNNVYAIAKLADDKCWTIENLRLDDSATLTSANTHNPSLPLTNIYDTGTTSNHLSPTSSIAYDATTAPEGWCTADSSACYDQSRLLTDNTTLFTSNTSSSQSGNIYSYGNYYNWYSATGGNGKYGSSYGDGYHSPGDICPSGWHLPKGGDKSQESTNELWQLIVIELNNGIMPANYYDSSTPYFNKDESRQISNIIRSYPNNYIYSGYKLGTTTFGRSSQGRYWTASGYRDSSVLYLYFDNFNTNSNLDPGTGTSDRGNGETVRCIAGSGDIAD
jgi:uncharacterized protein (TIGR02145 family)